MKNLSRVFKILFQAILLAIFLPFAWFAFNEIGKNLGYKKISVPVSGTGSMYPSLYWSSSEGGPEDPEKTTFREERTSPQLYRFVPKLNILSQTFKLHEISYADMVAFQNQQTAEILEEENSDSAGFIKRVIGLPGDTVEIRDGFLYRNDKQIQEPYIYKPRSTYGGEFLSDCHSFTIPEGKLFVLGDNRKASVDSRHRLGLVSISDISFYLPIEDQDLYRELWRDPSKDKELASQPTLNKQDFYQLLNNNRLENNVQKLSPNNLLENSAKLRGNVMIKTNDFTTEATRSGYTLSHSLSDAGYSNIKTGEFISHGYYTAEELIKNLIHFQKTKSHILDPDYQDIGVSVVNGKVNNCPTQVIVGHIGGYIPASYSQETIDSWQATLDRLNEVIPSWEKARDYEFVDQESLEELITILERRRSLAQEILTTMQQNQWLSRSQRDRIEQDALDAERSSELMKEISNS